jgi:phosphate transport system substrate-binding protein
VPALLVPAVANATTLFGSGSSAAQPYMVALFNAYHKSHKNIKFDYTADGGNAGVTDVQAGRSQFAIQTAAPVKADAGTRFVKLFLDAVCVDVNSSNKVSNIGTENLADVFGGLDTTWSQVSGSSLGSATIAPFGRNATAGLYTFFKAAVLAPYGLSQASDVAQETSDGLVATSVEHNTDGIGYVGLAHSKEKGEKSILVNHAGCNQAAIKAERYPLYHFDWVVLPLSHPSVAVEQFFNWVIKSKAAGKVINSAGAVAKFNA